MTRILLVLALAACGGGTQRAPTPRKPEPTKPIEVTDQVPPATPPSRSECQVLAQRMVQLAISERPADQQISQAEQDHIITAMTCDGVTRDIYDCAMAATTTASMAMCDSANAK